MYEHKLTIQKPRIEFIVENIERMVHQTNNYEVACLRLNEIGLDNELVTKYFDSYISKVKDTELLKQLLRRPMTMVQYMTALDTAVTEKDKDWVNSLMHNELFRDLNHPYLKELIEKANKL